MTASVAAELVDLLRLERLEDNLFRGQSRDIGTKYVFGGQVLGQALSAAQQTLAGDRHVHSIHAYFLRAGDVENPIVYDVDRTRDGNSFSVRRVTAIQHGKPIFVFAASFQTPEEGFNHQQAMPDVAAPEGLPEDLDHYPPARRGRPALRALPVPLRHHRLPSGRGHPDVPSRRPRGPRATQEHLDADQGTDR